MGCEKQRFGVILVAFSGEGGRFPARCLSVVMNGARVIMVEQPWLFIAIVGVSFVNWVGLI